MFSESIFLLLISITRRCVNKVSKTSEIVYSKKYFYKHRRVILIHNKMVILMMIQIGSEEESICDEEWKAPPLTIETSKEVSIVERRNLKSSFCCESVLRGVVYRNMLTNIFFYHGSKTSGKNIIFFPFRFHIKIIDISTKFKRFYDCTSVNIIPTLEYSSKK